MERYPLGVSWLSNTKMVRKNGLRILFAPTSLASSSVPLKSDISGGAGDFSGPQAAR